MSLDWTPALGRIWQVSGIVNHGHVLYQVTSLSQIGCHCFYKCGDIDWAKITPLIWVIVVVPSLSIPTFLVVTLLVGTPSMDCVTTCLLKLIRCVTNSGFVVVTCHYPGYKYSGRVLLYVYGNSSRKYVLPQTSVLACTIILLNCSEPRQLASC